jgi:hypothetical protein
MKNNFRSKLPVRAWVTFRFALALAGALLGWQVCRGQVGGIGSFGNRVGGVFVDAAGMVTPLDKSTKIPLRDFLRKTHLAAPAELNSSVEMRMVSLRRLEEAVQASGQSTAEMLPDDLRFLAGMQRIQYVLVYPEERDIVLAGPGEGWKVDEQGDIVGVTTGRPVLRIEDLIVAFRTVDNARQGGISCSIDPTPEGQQRYEALMAKGGLKAGAGALAAVKRAFGPQAISVTGVPADSHLARVLVSSDFHMKRIAMKLDPSPLKELPSFLDMLKRDGTHLGNMMPRWWMACDYEPLGRSEDGLAFELRGRGVKCLTEEEVVAAGGRREGTGKINPAAQKWANEMTSHYNELSQKEAAFGELRNVMDLCVIAALIAKEQLLAKAQCELPTLFGASGTLGVASIPAPKTVETQCSAMHTGSEYVFTASGGVQIASWQVADKTELRPAVAQIRLQARPTSSTGSVWWNPAQ